jgi:hypothetical protein
MIDALFVAGDPTRCRERLVEVSQLAREHGFQQLMFSELGSDAEASVRLLRRDAWPAGGSDLARLGQHEAYHAVMNSEVDDAISEP